MTARTWIPPGGQPMAAELPNVFKMGAAATHLVCLPGPTASSVPGMVHSTQVRGSGAWGLQVEFIARVEDIKVGLLLKTLWSLTRGLLLYSSSLLSPIPWRRRCAPGRWRPRVPCGLGTRSTSSWSWVRYAAVLILRPVRIQLYQNLLLQVLIDCGFWLSSFNPATNL